MLIDKITKPIALACRILFLVMICGCERDVSIRLDGKNPPTFNLSGSGNLVFLYVAEVRGNKRPAIEDPNLWEIRPVAGNKISSLPSITTAIEIQQNSLDVIRALSAALSACARAASSAFRYLE